MTKRISRKSPKAAKKTAAKRSVTKPRKSSTAKTAKQKLLSGGNPQIAKGYGDAPVQAYIAAIPDWRQDVARRLDALIVRAIPGVKKAVKWNSPFYGVEDTSSFPKSGDRFSDKNARQTTGVWFLSFHCFTKYVKVAFFCGAGLRPLPPGASKQKHVRYYDIYEGELDEAQSTAWVKQASKLPGERM